MSGYGCFARYYDLLTENVGYARRARYFDALIRAHRQHTGLLLDLACGTGSLSLELAALGYEVIGTDGSEEMLSWAMRKSLAAGYNILYLRQPMEELNLYGTVDVCVCALDSLNHLADEAALARVITRVALFLSPGGLFLFDLNTACKHERILADNVFFYDLPEVCCVWQNAYQGGEGHRVDIALDFFVPGEKGLYRRESERFSERVFAPEEVSEQLRKSGLETLAVYSGDTLEPIQSESQRAVYVTRKKGAIAD